MKKITLLLLFSYQLNAMQSSLNSDFNMRFGPDSHIYNTPLYFGSLNTRKERIKKNKTPIKPVPNKKMIFSN